MAARGTYKSTLGRWLGRQAESRRGYARAEKPLVEAGRMFAPGGTYGAGQRAIVEEEGRKTRAKALSGFVASGMSSGTNVAGMQARVGSDVARAKLGVEDVRTENLTQILAQLSGLRAAGAQQVGQATDPTYAPYMGFMGGVSQAKIGAAGQMASAKTAAASRERISQAQITSRERMAGAQKQGKFEVNTFKF